jgi:hypothetical protein
MGTFISKKSEAMKRLVESMATAHEKIFMHFSKVVPKFRSTRLLSLDERTELMEDIDNFWNAYIDNPSGGSVTSKLHFLRHRTRWMLELYGTLGFFAEDSIESIHAMVNRLASRFQALDSRR